MSDPRLGSEPGNEYFDRDELWGPGSSYDDQSHGERARDILELIPEDASVLDVGCGDGAITNILGESRSVVGADISEKALVHLRVPAVLASADRLPFPDRAFDCVLLSEVLEHLDGEAFSAALREVERVAHRHAIVTVPNRENLFASSVRCPRCGTRFSPWRHHRSFSRAVLRDLLSGFRLEVLEEKGPAERRMTTAEAAVRHLLARGAPLPFPAVCPKCGEAGDPVVGGASQGPSLRRWRQPLILKVVRPVQRRRWLVARYVRLADGAVESRVAGA